MFILEIDLDLEADICIGSFGGIGCENKNRGVENEETVYHGRVATVGVSRRSLGFLG
jgi:hypothetical protein